MTKISRYTLIAMTTLMASVVLPNLYWTAFDQPIPVPYVRYSCMIDDFTVFTSAEDLRSDTKGHTYTRSEYEALLPTLYTRQLMIDERMPDTIRGVAFEMHTFGTASSSTRIRPLDFQAPQPQLYPLFESESGRATLEQPDDVFRITWRMDFIDANTNTIDEEKSRLFSAALYHKGFAFPAQRIAGLPTTRKSCDEGYLVVDNDAQLFHIKLIQGLPYVRLVDLPKGLHFKHITCVDNKDKLFYAYLVAEDNSIYTLTQDDYQLLRWPIEDYVAEEQQLKVQVDYFHYNVSLQSDTMLQCYALDKNLQIVDQYAYHWVPNEQKLVGHLSAALFPFTCALTDSNSRFIRLYTTAPHGYLWLLMNMALVGLHIYTVRRRKVKRSMHTIDLIIIAITGIFGYIAVNIFPSKIISTKS